MCLKIYELDPAKFLSAPGLAWPAALKRTKVKLVWYQYVINGRKRYQRVFIDMQKLITNV